MRRVVVLAPALAAVLAAGATTLVDAPAGAAGAAKTTVTIKAEGVDLSGTVSSPKPRRCAKNRTVNLIKQIGTRGGGDDDKIGSDTAELQNGVYVWDTGNTGIAGKFYAKVKAIPGCKGATSKTVKAVRNP
ncbi:MAG: hypothetical protein QM747_09990 [Nocardioides sp.]